MRKYLYYLNNFFAILFLQFEVEVYENFFLHLCLDMGVHIKDKNSLYTTTADFLGMK